jgi:PhoPQ-activated pathogenicity-related protein
MSEETKPTRLKVKASALSELPQRGGLNKWVARTPSANTDFRDKSAGVRIQMQKKGHDIASLNRGRLRHPVFGHRSTWVQQSIAPGFFTKPIQDDADDLKRRISAALDKYMDELGRKVS